MKERIGKQFTVAARQSKEERRGDEKKRGLPRREGGWLLEAKGMGSDAYIGPVRCNCSINRVGAIDVFVESLQKSKGSLPRLTPHIAYTSSCRRSLCNRMTIFNAFE